MKKVFVAIPPKYDLDDNELRAFTHQVEKAAHKAEIILDEYVEIISATNLSHLRKNNDNGRKEHIRAFLFQSMQSMFYADLAVFAGNWESSPECKFLRNAAVAIDVPVIFVDTFDIKETENENE